MLPAMGCNSSTSKSHAGRTLLNSTNPAKARHDGSRHEDKPVAKVVSEAQVMQYTPTEEEEEEEEEKPKAARKNQRKVTPWHVAGAVNLDDEDDDEEVETKAEPETGSEPLQRKVKRKATPWTKVPVSDDEDDEEVEEALEEPVDDMKTASDALMELTTVKVPSATGGGNFCLFASCATGSCCGQDAHTELVLTPTATKM